MMVLLRWLQIRHHHLYIYIYKDLWNPSSQGLPGDKNQPIAASYASCNFFERNLSLSLRSDQCLVNMPYLRGLPSR